MKLSSEGKRLIYSFEGLHKKTNDGRYAAYLCPAGVPTIYAGLTEGVKIGMVITQEEGEELFAKEIAKFEDGVSRLVTSEINQNQFDALVSFAYNVGLGGFQTSSVLKHVNAGNWDKVPAAFALWNKGGGKVLPGLVSRRQREGALFMKPVEAPVEPAMPHQVAQSWPAWVLWLRNLFGVGAAGGGAAIATSDVGELPSAPDLSWWLNWKGFGHTAADLALWAAANPMKTAFAAAVLAVLMFPKLIPAKWRPSA